MYDGRVLKAFPVCLALFCLAASPASASFDEAIRAAADQGVVSSDEAESASEGYRRLSEMQDRDFVRMKSGIDKLVASGRLTVYAPSVVAQLHTLRVHGDRPNGERYNYGPAAVVQRYPGAGWQVMPLASASRVNALAGSSHNKEKVLTAARALYALSRPSGRSDRLEYRFEWWGRRPGWISGMTQSIAACAYARAYSLSGDEEMKRLSLRARYPVTRPAPRGAALRTAQGTKVLLYPWRQGLNVANAQLWSTWALGQAALHTKTSPRLAERAADQALSDLPGWASGRSWTLYASGSDPKAGSPASRDYHYLTVQALRRLCEGDQRFCSFADRFGEEVPASIQSAPAEPRLIG